MKQQFFRFLTLFLLVNTCNIVMSQSSKGYYDTGELKYEYTIVNGSHEGITKEYYKNGDIHYEWNYTDDKLNGITKEYDPDGNITEWTYNSDTLKTGKTFYMNGKNVEYLYNYKNRVKDGYVYRYYNTGEVHTKWTYDNGVLVDGIGYYETGETKYEFKYKDGKANGITNEYFKDGHLRTKFLYKDGKLNGISKEYDSKGNLKYDWNYSDGKLEGTTIEYYTDGSIKNKWLYENDVLK